MGLRHGLVAVPSWTALEDELRMWRDQGRRATFWWRDDDATRDTPALRTLFAHAERCRIPVALAVIPGLAEPSLVDVVRQSARFVTPVVHGYRHHNHATPGAKKSEFGPSRAPSDVNSDLRSAMTSALALFGEALLPIFVPPWNRMAEQHLSLLTPARFCGYSGKGPRRRPLVTDITVVDVHVDIIDWGGGRRFLGESAVLAALVEHLVRRRRGLEHGSTGLLTHHLVHDGACGAFLERLFSATVDGGGHWVDVRAAFGAPG